ncbi:MAG: hypothetical protein WCY11_05560 [Novosphingobium sp.]|jgi:hypothetical protein
MSRLTAMLLGAAALAGCASTQREEVRSGERNVQKQRQELDAAMRTGTKNEVREETKDLRQAEKELKEDRAKLYTQGTNGSEGTAYQVGQRAGNNLYLLPDRLRAQYPDGSTSYYRTDGRVIYRIRTADQIITGVSLVTP